MSDENMELFRCQDIPDLFHIVDDDEFVRTFMSTFVNNADAAADAAVAIPFHFRAEIIYWEGGVPSNKNTEKKIEWPENTRIIHYHKKLKFPFGGVRPFATDKTFMAKVIRYSVMKHLSGMGELLSSRRCVCCGKDAVTAVTDASARGLNPDAATASAGRLTQDEVNATIKREGIAVRTLYVIPACISLGCNRKIQKFADKVVMGNYESDQEGRNNGDAPTLVLHCEGCGKAELELGETDILKVCSRCKMSWYCSKECQTKDWVKHKKRCKPKKN